MSDLANSCEYLTIDKLCSAVSESEKAKANRKQRCQNDEKASCCYLCISRPECAVSCKFLGTAEIQAVPITPKSVVEAAPAEEKEVMPNQTEKPHAALCSLCYAEMAQAKTQLKIDGWKGPQPRVKCDEVLSAIVYLCPNCGKIEFKSDEQSKN